MAMYTIELRTVIASLLNLNEQESYDKMESLCAQAAPLIFKFDYPIFDTNYKSALEQKILRQFYLREIAVTPFGRWNIMLNNKLNEIMPYYNQLYESQLLKLDPFNNVNYKRSYDRNNNGATDTTSRSNETGTTTIDTSTNGTSSDTGKNIYKHSDTPQGTVANLEAGTYMTDANITDANNTVTTDNKANTVDSTNRDTDVTANVTINNLEKYSEQIVGKNNAESYSILLKEFRETFLNIDQMILEELESLFFSMYESW